MQRCTMLLLGTALCTSHCNSQAATPEVEAPALSVVCGDGEVAQDEECDPAAEGWQDSCDEECHRTSYVACETASDCAELNANCAAYQPHAAQLFCAPYCEEAADCPSVPGFEARCNFAWCAVSCRDGLCPHGMTCVPGQVLVDYRGQRVGDFAVCVVDGQ